MLRITQLVAMLFLFVAGIKAQDCPDNITPNSQQALEDLMAQFPNCEHLQGNLQLRNVTDLSPLSGIITIGGTLSLTPNYTGNDFTGLSSLTAIGKLYLLGHETITSLTGLESLTLIQDELRIQDITNLVSLEGLNSLTDVGTNVIIWDNDALTSLLGLESLAGIGGNLDVKWNDALLSTSGLNSLGFVGGDLGITENESIEVIDGFDMLHTVSGALLFGLNPNVIGIYGFGRLNKVGGDVGVHNMDMLAEVHSLKNVREMGQLRVTQNCQMIDLTNLEKVEGEMKISAFNMHTLGGCENIHTIGGSLILRTGMTNLPDFPSLTSVGGMLLIDTRAKLEIIDGFNNLENIGIGQLGWGLDIYEHDRVKAITGFNKLEQVAGDFVIAECDSLSDVSGFQNLFHVQGNFSISFNPVLEDCSPFCEFLLNRDPSLDTYIYDNGSGIESPCWREESLREECENRPVMVYDVDLDFNAAVKRKRPLRGALVELTLDGELVQGVTTDDDGIGHINYTMLEEGEIYNLDITHPQRDEEFLVQHRVTREDILNGFQVEAPFATRLKIKASTLALDTINLAIQIFGANALMTEIRGYDISEVTSLLDEWAVISQDHDQIIESMIRLGIGMHYILEYYESSTQFTTKMAKVSYDMVTSMATLMAIFKGTQGLAEKFTSFVDGEVANGNTTVDGLYAQAVKNLLFSIMNQSFAIMKATLIEPFLNSFGNSPEEMQFVGMMRQLIFIVENQLLKQESEILKASFQELIYNWLTAVLIQGYYIDFATQEHVEAVVFESLDMQGDFNESFQKAKQQYDESKETNEEALFAADFFEGSSGQINGFADVLENLSIALVVGSAGTMTHIAGPMMTVATGLKGLSAIISGANFLNYGERIVFLPIELGAAVSNISSGSGEPLEAYPAGYLDQKLSDLDSDLLTLVGFQQSLANNISNGNLDEISIAYLALDEYYRNDFNPGYSSGKGIVSAVAQVSDTTFRSTYIDYTSVIHRFEMQYLVLQLQLLAMYMDTSNVEIADSIGASLDQWGSMNTSLVGSFSEVFDFTDGQSYGPLIGVRNVALPDSLTDGKFGLSVTIENFGPTPSEPFEVYLRPNNNTSTFRLIDDQEVEGPYTGFELGLGDQQVLDFSVHVMDPDSSITVIVDFEGVESIDLSIPIEFVTFAAPATTNIDEKDDALTKSITIFPNPAEDKISIRKTPEVQIDAISIIDIRGVKVWSGDPKSQIFDVSGLPTGIYMLELVINDKVVNKKLIVK